MLCAQCPSAPRGAVHITCARLAGIGRADDAPTTRTLPVVVNAPITEQPAEVIKHTTHVRRVGLASKSCGVKGQFHAVRNCSSDDDVGDNHIEINVDLDIRLEFDP